MSIVEIVNVEHHPLDYEEVVDGHLDAPLVGAQNDVYAVDLVGWVLGRKSPVRTLEVWSPEIAPYWRFVDLSSVRRIPLTVDRPDVTACYPISAGMTCGFSSSLGVLGTPLEFECLLQVILEDGASVPLATVRVKREALRSGFEPTLQPLMVTGLGRSGSTWLMRLLAEHPQIVVLRRFEDTRASGYWMDMAQILSQPALPAQPMAFTSSDGWSVRQNPLYGPPITDDPKTRLWLGRGYPEQLAAFCQQAVEQLYVHTAQCQQQSEPRYFAEKSDPSAAWLTRELYPDMREIFLVRDFRDLVCSILAFDAKRGFFGFGRRPEDSDADYIRRFRLWTINLCRAWRHQADRAHLLRYEDLVRNPVESIQRALEYLHLDASPALVRRMLDGVDADSAALIDHRTSASALASIGRWRRDLPAEIQEVCQEVLADALREFGYDPA